MEQTTNTIMGNTRHRQLVFTEKDRCRVCFTCVRECPVKAIRIINGQAEVMAERCIGCGNCVKVCSQSAKYYLRNVDEVNSFLKENKKCIAILAPSFPAEFTDYPDYQVLIGMIRKVGFQHVCEVGFGADMVAKEYREYVNSREKKGCISSDCPAIAYYIVHYYSNLVPDLAPIASPMVAMSRIVRKKYGNDATIVFIGPCIAKKAESDEVDAVLTFMELRELFDVNGVSANNTTPSDFDPPFAGKGSIFPVSRGLLQNMQVHDDISEGNILVASGRINFRDAIDEYDKNLLKSTHLELLCCEGCIMGPGMGKNGKRYARRSIISNYVNKKLQHLDQAEWEKNVEEFSNLDYSQTFMALDRTMERPEPEKIAAILQKMGKTEAEHHLNCGACGYDTCIEHAIAIIQGLAEVEMCLPYSIEKLHQSIQELNQTNEELASARQALKQSEKLASMGQLSAGIAHELNNPLGVITMYSNILKDECREDDPLRKDLDLISEQADRCKKIVGGLLNFARKNQVRYAEVNIEKFTRQSLQSVVIPDNIAVSIDSNMQDPFVNLDMDQMMQVFTNLIKNAVEAMPEGGSLTIGMNDHDQELTLKFTDTGMGISQENMDKIFTPFFTTKKPGKGTGLGLPLIYGIVKMHKGQIHVQSNTESSKGQTGTSFIITLPRKGSADPNIEITNKNGGLSHE